MVSLLPDVTPPPPTAPRECVPTFSVMHCYFLSGIDNGSGHLALGLVSQSIFNVDNSMLDCGNVVMFSCRPKPSSKDTSPVQAEPLSINFPGS